MNAPPDGRGRGLAARLATPRVAAMFARNTVVSSGVFAVDLALLWLLVDGAGMGALWAAVLAFVVANSLHYAIGRRWIFRGTGRGVASGYVYFLANAGIGLAVTMLLYAGLMAAGMQYLVARIVASVFAGLTVFLLNATLNFRSV